MIARTESRITGRLLAAAAVVALAGGLSAALADPAQSESNQRPFTTDFSLDRCTFVTEDTVLSSGNPLFPLVPGHRSILEGEEQDAEIELWITTCLDDGSNCSTFDGTPVPGVRAVAAGFNARVIEEREWEDGELKEISHNFFVRCEENNAVVYAGETVENIEDGEVVDNGGSWEAGVGGATAGVVMPGLFLLGSRYFVEVAPDIAVDRAENVEMGLDVPLELAGGAVTLEGCVRVFETNDLVSSDRSIKVYCPDVGLVIDDAAELVDKNF